MDNEIIIFTDGSSRGNPGPGGWGAIIALPEGAVLERGGGEKKTTNNRMELMAVIESLKLVVGQKAKATVYSDSKYVLKGITSWVHGWKKNGWMTQSKAAVLNKDLWEELLQVVEEVEKETKINWKYTPGHVGIPGNERADEIACMYADGKEADLFQGGLASYPVSLEVKNEALQVSKPASKSRTGKAYVYVSLVDGEYVRHHDWPSCEARVKGKSGVKFKKAMSPEDEEDIKREWGVD